MTRVVLLIQLIICLPTSALARSHEDSWRVTLQEAYPGRVLAVSSDERLVAAADPGAMHILHLVDLEHNRVVLTCHLQDRLHAAAFAHQEHSLIVSTHESVYEIDLDTFDVKTLLPLTKGAVALNEDDSQLAVLGVLNEPRALLPAPSYHGPQNELQLGVYDLKTNKWQRKCDTPIVSFGPGCI